MKRLRLRQMKPQKNLIVYTQSRLRYRNVLRKACCKVVGAVEAMTDRGRVAATRTLFFAWVERRNPIVAALLRLYVLLAGCCPGERGTVYASGFSLQWLMQTIFDDDQDEHIQECRIEWAMQAVNAVLPPVTYANWPVWERVVAQAQVCARLLEECEVDLLGVAHFFGQVGWYLIECNCYADAEPLLKRAVAIHEEKLGSTHLDTCSSLNKLAVLFKCQGRYEEAEPLYWRVLAMREEHLGPMHPDTACSLNNLAYLYECQERYEEARPLYQRALVICEEQFGPAHSTTAISLNNLASLYDSLGEYRDAGLLYQRSLKICEEHLGCTHIMTQLVRSSYALLVQKLAEEMCFEEGAGEMRSPVPLLFV